MFSIFTAANCAKHCNVDVNCIVPKTMQIKTYQIAIKNFCNWRNLHIKRFSRLSIFLGFEFDAVFLIPTFQLFFYRFFATISSPSDIFSSFTWIFHANWSPMTTNEKKKKAKYKCGISFISEEPFLLSRFCIQFFLLSLSFCIQIAFTDCVAITDSFPSFPSIVWCIMGRQSIENDLNSVSVSNNSPWRWHF